MSELTKRQVQRKLKMFRELTGQKDRHCNKDEIAKYARHCIEYWGETKEERKTEND